MNEMTSNRDYDRDYRDGYRDSYRGGSYRDDYRDYRDYRDDYRDDYRRDYDRRGGKINYRNYRNYRENYHEELEELCYDMKEIHRKIEDVAEMTENAQDKNMLMKIAQKEKENYSYLKQLMEK